MLLKRQQQNITIEAFDRKMLKLSSFINSSVFGAGYFDTCADEPSGLLNEQFAARGSCYSLL